MRPTGRAAVALSAVLTVLLATTACGSAKDPSGGNGLPTGRPGPDDGRIAVVAAEGLWGDIAHQIGGDRVQVSSILDDPDQDPHEYESGVADAALIDRADLVIVNGAGYDPFMGRLLSADPKSGRTVLDVGKIVGVGSDANPHLWYDPDYVVRAARGIAASLRNREPGHAAQFRHGLAAFLRGERTVRTVIAQIRQRHAGESVGYTEPVPGYLVAAAGLRLGTPAGFSAALENGTDPSPGDSAHFEQSINDHRTEALLLNTQVGDPETDRLADLARSRHVPVVDVTETLPRGKNFQTWQRDQARALLAALDG